MLVRIVDFAIARGFDGEALCKSVGISAASLRDKEARFPYSLAEALGERAAEMIGDANIGLHLARDVARVEIYDVGLLMMMASVSIRAALDRMVRHQRYWGDGQRCSLHGAKAGVIVRYTFPSERTSRHNDECAMAEITIGLRSLLGKPISPRIVRFRHAAPADRREHDALFACPLVFFSPHTELELDDEVLDAPLAHANEAYCTIFEEQVERTLASLPPHEGARDAVRTIAKAALAAGTCSISQTAKALRMSVRTMQRRLREEGTTFEKLIDGLRKEMAHAYLDQNIGIQEIAILLGYADVTAFHHAFKRWTGTSPNEFRRRAS